MNTTQVTSTGVAVTLAVLLALGLLFYGPHLFDFFTMRHGAATAMQTATTTDTAAQADTAIAAPNQTNPSNQAPAMDTSTNANAAAAHAALSKGEPLPIALPNPIPTELAGQDVVVGTGATAAAGHSVTVQYVGQLTNGSVFDASAKHGTTGFTFNLGGGQVIKGWDVGVAGMKVGGVRRLIIPASMGYGSQAMGSTIPANSTLVFDVELLGVK